MGSLQMKDSNREAFELVVANKLQNSLYHSVFFNEATGWYDCADDAPAAVQFFCCGLNSDWRIWQAAKAQAEKALLEQFEINNKLVEQIEKLKADVPGQITLTHERLQELIAIGVKAELDEQKTK